MIRAMIRKARDYKAESRRINRNHRSKILTTAVGAVMTIHVLSVMYSELAPYYDYLTKTMEMLQSGQFRIWNAVNWPVLKPLDLIVALALFLMQVVFAAGYQGYCLLWTRGTEAVYRDILPGWKTAGKIVAIRLLQFLAVVGGLVLLIVPGIWCYYNYRLSVYILLDHPELSPVECMKRSRKQMAGNKRSLFALDLLYLPWKLLSMLVSMVTVPVVEVWLISNKGIAEAALYADLAE